MALSYLSYTSAIAALLNNGKQQVLPISMANLIELAKDKTNFGPGAQSVQDALSYLAGSFDHANTVAKNEADRAERNAYAYVGQEINKLDVNAVGSATDAGHDKFISYIYQEDGKIEAFAQDMTAANVAYAGGSDGRATVQAELEHINATIAKNLDDTTLTLVHTVGANENAAAESVTADGTEYRLKQGDTVVAKFNIEKDSFVKSGSVVWRGSDANGNTIESEKEPIDGIHEGAYYIKLEIKTHDAATDTAAESTLYIPAESLVDVYKADNAGKNVTVTVNQDNNTISAVIKAGGVGTNELAADAVTTVKIANDAVETAKIKDAAVTTEKIANSAVITDKINASAVTTDKIADKNVTKAKLEDIVQASLNKADSALQKADITTGSAHGTIAVGGSNVDVNLSGLAKVATSGKAEDVSVATIAALDEIADLSGGSHVDDVQEALEKLAVKVKAINDGAVTSVKTSVVDSGKDTQNAVTISMTPTEAKNGAVTVELTHNLGSAAALDYDATTSATPVSSEFWTALNK